MFGISAFAEAPFSALSQTLVSTPLTGVSAAGEVGTVSRGPTSIALSGVVASGFAGAVAYVEGQFLSNDSAAGLVGTVVPTTTVAITGVAASGLAGSVIFGNVLTGVSASGNVGTVAFVKSIALSGVQGGGSVGTVSPVYWILVNTSQTSNWSLVETD